MLVWAFVFAFKSLCVFVCVCACVCVCVCACVCVNKFVFVHVGRPARGISPPRWSALHSLFINKCERKKHWAELCTHTHAHTNTETLFFSIPEGPLRNRKSWRITVFLEEMDGHKLSGNSLVWESRQTAYAAWNSKSDRGKVVTRELSLRKHAYT